MPPGRPTPGRVVRALVAASVLLTTVTPVAADRPHARRRAEHAARLLATGERAAALDELERAIADDPDYLPAYDAAIDLWLEAKAWRVLVARLSAVTLRQPTYVTGWYTLGFAYRKLGRYDLAAMCYQAYVDLRPFDPDPRYGLAMAALEGGDTARAIAALRRYLELERRADREAYVERARAELAALGVAAPGGEAPGVATLDRLAHQLARAGRAAWRVTTP